MFRALLSPLVVVLVLSIAVSSMAMNAREVAERLAAGDFEAIEAEFAPVLSRVLGAAQLSEVWSSVVDQDGGLCGIGDIAVEGSVHTVPINLERATYELRLSYAQDSKIAGIWLTGRKAPALLPPAGVREIEVAIGPDEAPLAGRISLPEVTRNVPGVVIIHGSGPADMDGTVGLLAPYRDIAWGLAERGVAVLRFPKRTAVYPQEVVEKDAYTIEDEYIGDALHALQVLAGTDGIDSSEIYLVGHSYGGYIAPRIATQTSDIRGIIFLSAPRFAVEEMMARQLDRGIAQVDRLSSFVLRGQIAIIREMKENGDFTRDGVLLGAPASYYKDLHERDPMKTMLPEGIRVLIVAGEDDFQVCPDDRLTGEETIFSRTEDISVRVYKGLTHLMTQSQGQIGVEQYNLSERVSNKVLDDLAAWITEEREANGNEQLRSRIP